MSITLTVNKKYSDYVSTSTDSNSFSVATKTWTVETGKAYNPGDTLWAIATGAKLPTRWSGDVVSYDSVTGALSVSINRLEGGTPDTAWLDSSTSNNVSTGSKTFQIRNGMTAYFTAGDPVIISRRGTNAGNRMIGTVTSYDNATGTLVVNITSTQGTGTGVTDWCIASSGTFSNWVFAPAGHSDFVFPDAQVLTVDATPEYVFPNITNLFQGKVLVVNNSTTTPIVITQRAATAALTRCESNGSFQVRGAPITLFTGNGTAGQSFTLNGVFSKIDFPSVFVETSPGSGVYCPYKVFLSDADEYGQYGNIQVRLKSLGSITNWSVFGSGELGNWARYTASTRTLQFGDGTNGNVVPSGCKVAIPNIHITSLYPETTLMSAMTNVATTAFPVANTGYLLNGGYAVYIDSEEVGYNATSGVNVGSTSVTRGGGAGAAAHAQGSAVYFRLSYTVTNNDRRGITDFDSGGKCDIDWCSFGLYLLYSSNAQSLSVTNFGCYGRLEIANTSGPAFTDNVVVNLGVTDNASNFVYTVINGESRISNIYTAGSAGGTNASPSGISLSNVSDISVCENLEGNIVNRNGTATPAPVNLSACFARSDVYFKNIRCIGGRLAVSSTAVQEFDGIYHSDNVRGISNSSVAMDAMYISASQSLVFRNVSKLSGGAACRSSILRTNSDCKDIIFHTVTYDGDGNSAINHALLGLGIKVANATFTNLRDSSGISGVAASNQSDTIVFQNVSMPVLRTYQAGVGLGLNARCFYDYVNGPSVWWNTTGVAGNYPEHGPFHVILNSGVKNAGFLSCGGFGIEVTRDIYDFTGTAYANNAGRLMLPVSGDSVVIKSYQPLRSITAFSATPVAVEAVNPGNLSLEFKLAPIDQDLPVSWTALDATNLQSSLAGLTGYDSDSGIKMHVRVTAISTASTNSLANIRMFTNNDAAFSPPIGYTTLTLTGLAAGTYAEAYSGGVKLSRAVESGGSASLLLPYNYDGLDSSVDLEIRAYGYQPADYTQLYRQTNIVKPVSQEVDSGTSANYATAIAYTGFAWDGNDLTVTADHTPQELYDWAQAYAIAHDLDPFVTGSPATMAIAGGLILNNAQLTGSGSIITVGTQRTNQFQRSEDFSATAWPAIQVDSIVGGASDPFGGTLASVLTKSSAGDVRNQVNYISFGSAVTYSIYLKKSSTVVPDSAIRVFTTADSVNHELIVNAKTGAFSASNGTGNVESVGSYWRISLSYTSPATGIDAFLLYPVAATDATTGSATFFGTQVEYGNSATTYIPTSGAPRTVGGFALSGTGDTDHVIVVGSVRKIKLKAPNLVSGTRVYVKNTATSAVMDNSVVGASGYSLRIDYTADINYELRATWQSGTAAKIPLKLTGLIGSTGLTLTNAQENLTDYSTLGVDGSTCSEFTLDGANLEIDANDVDGVSQKRRVVAWYYYAITTSAGIADFYGAIELLDAGNAVIRAGTVDLLMDNISAVQLLLSDDDFYMYRDDGQSFVKFPSTGGYGITFGTGKVYGSNPFALVSESGQTYGKQFRDMRAVLLGKTTGGGSMSESFLAADGVTTRVVSVNDGQNRTDVSTPGA